MERFFRYINEECEDPLTEYQKEDLQIKYDLSVRGFYVLVALTEGEWESLQENWDNSAQKIDVFLFCIPGIKIIAQELGWEFVWDGFVPALKKENDIIQLNIEKIRAFAMNHEDDKIVGYIKGLLNEET